MRWDKEVFDRIFRASGLKSKEYFKKRIVALAKSLGIKVQEGS